MRIVKIMAFAVAALTLATLPSVAAVKMQKGRAGISNPLPNLGPAGNGRRLWVEFNCYLCHGSNGGGQFGPNVQHAEGGDVSEAVRQGDSEGGMPSYGKYVNGTDIKNLTAYLASIGTKNEPTWWDWWVPHPKQ
jgi:cytochrome c551